MTMRKIDIADDRARRLAGEEGAAAGLPGSAPALRQGVVMLGLKAGIYALVGSRRPLRLRCR